MTIVIAQEDVRHTREGRVREDGRVATRTDFMYPPASEGHKPQAYLVEESPERHLRAHFHEQDQFQVFLTGTGTVGRHEIKPLQVHFARRYTPYGPLIATGGGYSYLTLRTRRDPGAQLLPEQRPLLDSISCREPWQVTAEVRFPEPTNGVDVLPLEGIRDDRGLQGWAASLDPGAAWTAPSPATGAGQYVVVIEGSLLHEGRERQYTTLAYLTPDDAPFELVAGPRGLRALVLNFPRAATAAADAETAQRSEGGFKTWQCVLCGFVYDEAAGMPDHDIAPGTRWADVPDSFGCPDCSASKADFMMMEAGS